jgi:hypothetical protein
MVMSPKKVAKEEADAEAEEAPEPERRTTGSRRERAARS